MRWVLFKENIYPVPSKVLETRDESGILGREDGPLFKGEEMPGEVVGGFQVLGHEDLVVFVDAQYALVKGPAEAAQGEAVSEWGVVGHA